MADTIPTATLVFNGESIALDNVIGEIVRTSVANLDPKVEALAKVSMVEQVMPVVKPAILAVFQPIIDDWNANGWPEIDRLGRLTGNKVPAETILTNLLLHQFGEPSIETYPDPTSKS
jgi:hypothetical protein